MNQLHEWSFVLVAKSPLRIGTDDGDLLLDDNGRPFLPGTSWAGACRAYMMLLGESYQTLFGSQGKNGVQQPSQLLFSDGICITPQPFEVRPRVRLNRATKTVQNEKFDMMMVSAGVKFKVKLTLRTDNDDDKDMVETMLDALNRGWIRLGANKSIGNGKFEIEDGHYVRYDFTRRDDLEAFVEQSKPSESWKPGEKIRARIDVLRITFSGELISPLLISGIYPNDSSKPDRSPIQSSYDGEMRYIIPASSFKGALRHQTARIIRFLSVDPSLEEHIFDGRIYLEDILLEEPKTKIYYRVAINPLTGGTKDGALMDEETVIGNFSTNLLFKYDDQSVKDRVAAALLLFALRDLSMGRQTIGSGQGIGRGDIRLSEIAMSYGDKSVVINFLNRTIQDPDSWLSELQKDLDNFAKEAKAVDHRTD